jgi:hypothetical protein
MSETRTRWDDVNWSDLSRTGWPQLRECTYVALEMLAVIDDPQAASALAVIRKILSDGAHDPGTTVTPRPPAGLISLMKGQPST